MFLDFLSNLVLILSIAGILVLFLRRVPEVVEEKGQLHIAAISAVAEGRHGFFSSFYAFLAEASRRTFKRLWKFILEAKDLKQGQIIAAKFAKIIPQGRRIINLGVHSNLRKADRLIQEKQYDQAEQVYLEIIRSHPHEYAVYEGLVNVYLGQENYDNIHEILRYLIKHNPSNDIYLAQLGDVLSKTGRYQEAAASYERSLEINSLVSERHVRLAKVYQALGERGKAKESFVQALDLDPMNIEYLIMAVDSMVILNQVEQALAHLEKVLEMNQDNFLVKQRLLDVKNKLLLK